MLWYLIRHAESEANKRSVWTGQQDVPLSREGRRQLLNMRERRVPPGDFYVSSPLRRCTDSLRLLYGKKADLIVPEFAECDLGEWVGLPYENLTTDPLYLRWVRDGGFAPPGGESLNAFRARVEEGFYRVFPTIRRHEKVVFLLHGNVIRALLSLLTADAKAYQEWKIPNSGGYALAFEKL